MDLVELEVLYQRSRAIMVHHRQIAPIGVTDPFGQLVANLTGRAPDPTRLTGPSYDEVAQLALLSAINYRGAAFVLGVTGTFARYLFRDLPAAREFLEVAAEYADGAVATYSQVWLRQLRVLITLSTIDVSSKRDVAEALVALEPDVAQLRTWQHFSAVNHDHRVSLVDAELARVTGNEAAAGLYDRAIAVGLENGFTHEAALAAELSYRHHLARRSHEVAQKYFAEACALYARWGASAKVTQLMAEADQRTRLSGT